MSTLEELYPFDPDDPDPKMRLIGAFVHIAGAADNFLTDVPSDMKGEYIDDLRRAWDGLFQPVPGLKETIEDIISGLQKVTREALEYAGFVGQAGKAKLRQLGDAIAEFFKLRSGPRAAKMLRACVYVLASMVSLVPGIEAIKEAFEGFKYVADLALKGD